MVADKTIEYFYKKEKISFKSYQITKDLGIVYLFQLKNFVDENNNFLKVKGCQNKHNYELLKLYEDCFINKKTLKSTKKRNLLNTNAQILNKKSIIKTEFVQKRKESVIINNKPGIESENKSKTGTVTLEFLYSVNTINKKCFNLCKVVGINNLNDLHDYIKSNDNFLSIPNCTNVDNYQILDLYIDYYMSFCNNKSLEVNENDSKKIKRIKNNILIGIGERNDNAPYKQLPINTNGLVNKKIYVIDGYEMNLIFVENEMAPLFWVKREGLTQNIYLNRLHSKSNLFPDEGFITFLVALTRTSLSFSDDSGDIFLNRLKNYLDLI
jgi:hypothetical protein